MDEPLVGDEIEFAVMDEVHLGRTGFLDGILDGKYIYRYKKGRGKNLAMCFSYAFLQPHCDTGKTSHSTLLLQRFFT